MSNVNVQFNKHKKWVQEPEFWTTESGRATVDFWCSTLINGDGGADSPGGGWPMARECIIAMSEVLREK